MAICSLANRPLSDSWPIFPFLGIFITSTKQKWTTIITTTTTICVIETVKKSRQSSQYPRHRRWKICSCPHRPRWGGDRPFQSQRPHPCHPNQEIHLLSQGMIIINNNINLYIKSNVTLRSKMHKLQLIYDNFVRCTWFFFSNFKNIFLTDYWNNWIRCTS